MLSRVAERVYWMARYLERVENTSRLINAYTSLLLDSPEASETDWFRLVEVFDSSDKYFEKHDKVTENDVMQFLVSDENNPLSLVSTMKAMRENARTSMDVLPELLWEQVNELYRLLKGELSSVSNRHRRQHLLLAIMEQSQGILGIVNNQMSRNYAYYFLLAGKYLERADMTSRIIELAAIFLKNNDTDTNNKRVWLALLNALGAKQMYIQSYQLGIEGEKVLRFLVMDERFPRSVRYSLNAMRRYLEYLPNSEMVVAKQDMPELGEYQPKPEDINEMQLTMDDLQIHLNDLNSTISHNWFYPDKVDESDT